MHRQLHVRWFDRWAPALDDAIAELPMTAACPADLYRELATSISGRTKRIALVTQRDDPVAVIALRRRRAMSWQPVTQWIVPGFITPVRTGQLIPALAALRVQISVAWWRMGPVPDDSRIRGREDVTVHRIDPAQREEFWRQSSCWRDVLRARNQCKELSVLVNPPGAAEHVLREWHERWQGDDDLTDRIIAARYLEECGRYFTVMIHHGDRPVAGVSAILDGNDLAASVSYRDLTFGRRPTGTRAIDAIFELAAERGFAAFDVGGGQEYKQRWAPACGTRSSFVIAPDPVYYSGLAWNRARSLAGHGVSAGRRLLAKHQ